MDITDSTYIVGWLASGETEVKADNPEQAITKLKRQMRGIYAKQADTKLSLVKSTFAMPHNSE